MSYKTPENALKSNQIYSVVALVASPPVFIIPSKAAQIFN